MSYNDGGSDSESGHDVYLERVKAEGQERDSEDGTWVTAAIYHSWVLCACVTVEDSDFVANDSGSEEALESVTTYRISMLVAPPTTGMMSLQKIATKKEINLWLKRSHTSPSQPQALREAKK